MLGFIHEAKQTAMQSAIKIFLKFFRLEAIGGIGKGAIHRVKKCILMID